MTPAAWDVPDPWSERIRQWVPHCFTCGQSLRPGDMTWAPALITYVEYVETGPGCTEVRHTCGDCEAKR